MPRIDDVPGSDGVTLAVWADGPPDAPVVVCVHGYPDDHTVWDGVSGLLADRYRVVRHDVRGAGRSGAPGGRDGYRIEHLVADIGAVLDATGAPRVHLVAHDWGSVQAWGAVRAHAGRIASFTSMSGPDLGQTVAWYRDQLRDRHVLPVLRQLGHSWYIGMFLLPGVAELGWRSGLVQQQLPREVPAPRLGDAVNGLQLYRANILRSARSGATSRVGVPVQILAPDRDVYVAPAVQIEGAEPWVDQLRSEVVPGHHWVLRTDPAMIAERVDAWARAHPA